MATADTERTLGDPGQGIERKSVLPAFKLERYFAKWEFKAPHLLCCSDCEPVLLSELLSLMDGDSRARWEGLRLSYGETRGLPALIEEICKLYEQVRPEGVLVSAPQECIYLAMMALLQPGDHAVVTYPGYQSLYQVAESLGCQVDLWEWSQLVAACRGVGCYLFSDEMYRLLEFDPAARLPSAVDVYDKAITLSGLSKAFGLPGLRIGWLAMQPPCYSVLGRAAELKDYTTICNAVPSDVLALAALRSKDALLHRNMTILRSNLSAVESFMGEFDHIFRYRPPAAGSVAFPRLAALATDNQESVEEFCERLVNECGVLLLPATVYDHAPSSTGGHFRIGLGRRDLPGCLDVFRSFLRERVQRPQQ
ncbi:hypothetical protein VOLCADRAFT_88940 [Volvox carteri f. nagariensis]|uniref:Aminotransferase class I/classII large domain-containing protein n=1 Tax=Volvox carteri f. nagariensis TaxID=3068 RepID=D8TQD2_VOLCA|nr:uncharacterized protein VOLCADRAFT_88940 [Volvox carteri f. nagariensis]EFJ50513.1 hypothetical protein VOLCADRAFT_88940 [Volvox carteri f. nagariensis]|eukprot:XP_002948638.1 hypothetical protein VOLCADRAFT_88940 [Volvox carteri f. nagariensis]